MNKVTFPLQKNPLMMPVVLISTISSDGILNFSSVAWISKINSNPLLFLFSMGPHKKTFKNIIDSRSFGINIPTRNQIKKVDYCGLNSGNTVSKHNVFSIFNGNITGAPLIQECPVNIECEVWDIIEMPKNHLVIGEVKQILGEEKLLKDNKIDIYLMNPILHSMAGDNIYFEIGDKTDDAYVKKEL